MKLNKRVTIQKIKDAGPLKNKQYENYKTVWASISNLHGKEFIEAQKVSPKISKKIIIRYFKCLDPSININASTEFTVLYKGNIYNILYIDNIKEENKYMELLLES